MRLINATHLIKVFEWYEKANLPISSIIEIIDSEPTMFYPAVINLKPLTHEEKQTLLKALRKNGLTTVALYCEDEVNNNG